MSENRFLQSFCTVTASAVLVCGTLVLLTSTAPWSPLPQPDSEPSTPDSARVSMEATASIDAQAPEAPLASDQADASEAAEPDVFDAGLTGAEVEAGEPSQVFAPEAPSPEADDALAALGMPLDPETADASSDDSGADVSITAAAASGSGTASETPAEFAVSVPLAKIASLKSDAATDQIAEMLAALPPGPNASEKSDAATTQVAAILAATPPAPPPPPAPVASDETEAATNTVATVLAASAPAPAPLLPLRKPVEKQPEPKVAALPTPQAAPARQEAAKQDAAKQVLTKQVLTKQDLTKQNLAQQDAAQPHSGKGPWQPMALAPADKPSISLSKAPINKPSGGAYASKVWAALARHKPRAGQRGSTTVAFSIGENGTLRGVRVGRSSGNSRIDQLALATVRNAAPFPPPPSGAASYSIRIDFQ